MVGQVPIKNGKALLQLSWYAMPGIYGSQTRDDYSVDDVEHYFNYMGMLAMEGTYDRLKKLQDVGHPVDVLLLMAASENDTPKVAELLRAGADVNVKVCLASVRVPHANALLSTVFVLV